LTALEQRRLRLDLIETYKIITGKEKKSVATNSSHQMTALMTIEVTAMYKLTTRLPEVTRTAEQAA